MSIHLPDYARPPPQLLPRSSRLLAIFENGVRERLGVLNVVLLAFLFVVIILPLALVFYLQALLPLPAADPITLFYFPFGLGAWFFFLVLLASSVGAAAISGDVASRTLTLYLARPIERSDYLIAKAGTVGLWMLLGAVLPGVVGVFVLLALGYISLPLAFSGFAGYLGVGLLAAISFSALALLLSSLTARRAVAGAGIFGALIGAEVIAVVLAAVSRQSGFGYLSPNEDLLAVANSAFHVGGDPLDPWTAAGVLLVLSAFSILVAYGRIARSEVVGE